jgi:hypothetical protein
VSESRVRRDSLESKERCDHGVKAPRSWPCQHHNGQSDAVERFGQVQRIVEPVGAIDRLPCAYAFDAVEYDDDTGVSSASPTAPDDQCISLHIVPQA